MLKRFLVFITLLSMTFSVSANTTLNADPARVGIMAVLGAEPEITGLGIGMVRYAPTTEIGFNVSGSVNNAHNATQTVVPVVFAGLRKNLNQQTYFAYGVSFTDIAGHIDGLKIDAFYQVGPYIALEQMLTNHLMLSGWILPYQYDYEKIGGVLVSGHDIFSAGGIAFNYLF